MDESYRFRGKYINRDFKYSEEFEYEVQHILGGAYCGWDNKVCTKCGDPFKQASWAQHRSNDCEMCRSILVKSHYCTGISPYLETEDRECQLCHPHTECIDGERSYNGTIKRCGYLPLEKNFKYMFMNGVMRKYRRRIEIHEKEHLDKSDLVMKIEDSCYHYKYVRKFFSKLKVSYLCKLFIIQKMFTDFEKILEI